MRILFYITVALAVLSCKKDDPVVAPGKYENGLLVLNEGLFQQNNSSISFYSSDDKQVYQQVFFSQNGRGLGDTANDFEKFQLGDSTYILLQWMCPAKLRSSALQALNQLLK